MKVKTITYSPSLTIPLTRACINQCLYCGYRRSGEGLYPVSAINKIIEKAYNEGIPEILILAGEKADKIHEVRNDLDLLGMNSFVSWTKNVCEYLLYNNLLPHVNIGPLNIESLRKLKGLVASMGLMIEGINPVLNAKIHPGKNLQERFKTIDAAGKLKIPFTTGILIGTGEKQRDRLASILAVSQIQKNYGHIQEFIIQKYVTNEFSCLPSCKISFDEMIEIIDFCKKHLPNVYLQVPPNIEKKWEKLLRLGIDDLGGLGNGVDLINPEKPWPDVQIISNKLKKLGLLLKKRLPIYPMFYFKGWYSKRVGKVVSYWIEKENEYKYYSDPSI